MTEAIITVLVVLAIFSLFAWGASRAEKAVATKAKLTREARLQTVKGKK